MELGKNIGRSLLESIETSIWHSLTDSAHKLVNVSIRIRIVITGSVTNLDNLK